MSLSRRKILKVSKGQIAKELIERTDIGILDASGQEITNWHNSKYGAIKTESGTVLRYSFGNNQKIKLQKLRLPDNNEGFIAFNGTDHTLKVFNSTGVLISNNISFPQVTETNYKDIQLAQNQDLILICTGDNPIMRLTLDLPNATSAVFNVPASKILKAANVSVPTLNPVLFRMGNEGLPVNPTSIGMEIGDCAYPNSGTANPNTAFPWSVQKLISLADPNTWKISSAKIATLGTGYQIGDTVETQDGKQFVITSLSSGATLTIYAPEQTYSENPTANGVSVNGGSGTGMTINIVGQTTQTIWQSLSFTPNTLDVIRDNFNGTNWQWTGSSWIIPSLTATDQHYGVSWTISATAGVVKVTGVSNVTLLTLTAPAGIDPTEYAKSMLYGVQFDGENAIGILSITEITGTVSGQTYQVKTITGMTVITFDSASGNKTGFTIKFSQVKVFDGNYPNTNDNPSATTNYPLNILFYQQRLIIAGTRFNRSQMIWSVIGQYDDFTDDKLDNAAFQLIIGSTEKEEILAVLLNQGIQIFTTNNEWLMNDQMITRASGFIRNSSIGTNGVQPIIAANGVTLFTPKNGKGIIGFTYNFQSASYSTPYITLFTDLLDDEITDLMLKRGLDSQDDTLIFICDIKGEMIIGNYLQEHDIQAFCSRKADNVLFQQTIQVESNIVFLAQRNGVTAIELIDTSKYTAHAVPVISYNSSTGIINITQSQYEGQALNVYDGNHDFVGSYTVTDGKITIPNGNKPSTVSEVGFNIHSTFESNPININAQTKSIFKTINTIKIAVTEESRTEFLTVNGKYGRREENLVHFVRPARPLRDCRFIIENDVYPCEILSMELDIEA